MLSKLFMSRKGVTDASIAAAVGVSALFALASASAASAAPATVYDNGPTTVPGERGQPGVRGDSRPRSSAARSTSTRPQGTTRGVTMTMSSWACQSGGASTKDCSTTPGARFTHPIRFNVYRVQNDNEPGRLVGAVTRTYKHPVPAERQLQPPAQALTPGSGSRRKDSSCKNGKAVRINASLGSLDLPEKAIISVEYNTSHYGYEPIGDPLRASRARAVVRTTASTSASATRARSWAEPTVGTQPTPDDAYLNSSSIGAYCDGSLGNARSGSTPAAGPASPAAVQGHGDQL